MSASPVASTSKPESSTATISATATAPKPASPAPSPTVTAAPSKPALEVKKPETADDKIARAKAMNDRFKRRGKRTATAVDPSSKTQEDAAAPASKKAKGEDKDSKDKKGGLDDEYLREVQGYMNRSLKDEGAGKRPLVR